MRRESRSTQNDQLELLELVGGPFCGSVLQAPTGFFEPGEAIATRCFPENSPRQVWHLDAVYLIAEDYKGLFMEYAPKEL